MPNISRFAVGSARSLGLNAAPDLNDWVLELDAANTITCTQAKEDLVNNAYYISGALYGAGLDRSVWVGKTDFFGALDPSFKVVLAPTSSPTNYNLSVIDTAVDTANNLLYLAVNVTVISTNAFQTLLIKYDLATNTVSLSKQNSGLGGNRINEIKLSSDGSALYALSRDTILDFYISKISTSTFAVSWSKKITASGYSEVVGNGLSIDSADNIYVSGYVTDSGSSVSSGLLVCWNSSGVIQWQKRVIASPTNPTYDYTFNRNSLSASQTRVGVDGFKTDVNGSSRFLFLFNTSDGSYSSGETFTLDSGSSGTSTTSSRIPVPNFALSTSTNLIFVNGYGAPDGVNVKWGLGASAYKLEITGGDFIIPTEIHVGVNTLRNRYAVPFGSNGSKAYFASLLGAGNLANGTYGPFTIDTPNYSASTSSFTVLTASITEGASTLAYTTNFSLTKSTLTLTSETRYALP